MPNKFSKSLKPIKSICILRLSAIGDCCHVVALVQYLQKMLPEVEITWVIGKVEASLISYILPNVKLVEFDKKQGLAAYSQLRRDLRGKSFDFLLHLQPNMRANLASWFIKAKNKVGYHSSRARELQNLFVNQQAPLGRGGHVADSFMDFAVALGLPETTPTWSVSAAQDDLDWVEKSGLSAALIICPSASNPERNWTNKGYAKLIDNALEKGHRVILIGSPASIEVALGTELLTLVSNKNHPYLDNLIGKTDLPKLLALIQLAKLVVAPDTGPAHIATLVGTPVVGLYAAQNPQRTGPYNDLDKVVSVYQAALKQETGKTPEEVSWRTRVKLPNAMEMIDEAKVLQMVEKYIA